MSGTDQESNLSRTWRYAKRYWHWPVLLVVGFYLYSQYMPSIDLRPKGAPAPPMVGETTEGDTFRLEAQRGDVVVVNVWATWCGPCRVELPGFVDLQEEFGEEVQFVGIAVDRAGAEAVRPYVEEAGVNFPQIANPRLAATHFPGEVVPRTYLIDKRGRIRYKHTGVILKWALDDAIERLLTEDS